MVQEDPAAFLPYGYHDIQDEDVAAVVSVLKSQHLTTGPAVGRFEQALCETAQAKHAVVCGNGTQALHLACMSIGLGPGDAAIVPTMTFLATANAVRYCGADVIFADVDPATGLMRAQDLSAALADNPAQRIKAVLPVHLSGQTVNMPALREVAEAHGLHVVTDASHALGARLQNDPVGSCRHEDITTFSFHPVKLVAMGEGGALTTRDPALAERASRLRSHAMIHRQEPLPWIYEMHELGYNYRASDIHCALGCSQLQRLPEYIARRRELAACYAECLRPLEPFVSPPVAVEGCDPAWHIYCPRIQFSDTGVDRAAVMRTLRNKGIGTQVHYIPVHTQPYYRGLYGEQRLPGAERYYNHTLTLPLHVRMTRQDVERVAQALAQALQLSPALVRS